MVTLLRDFINRLKLGRSDDLNKSAADLQLQMLQEVGRVVAGSLQDLETSLELICEATTSLLQTERAIFLRCHGNLSRLFVRSGRGLVDLQAVIGLSLPLDLPCLQPAFEQAEPIVIDGSALSPQEGRDYLERLNFTYFIACQVNHKGECLGLLLADGRRPGAPFLPQDHLNLQSLTELVAKVQGGALLMDAVKKQNKYDNCLQELEGKSKLSAALEDLLKASPGDSLTLYVPENESQLKLDAALGDASHPAHLQIGQGIPGWAFLTQKQLLVHDLARDPRCEDQNLSLASGLATPILKDAQPIAILYLQAQEPGQFQEVDGAFFRAAAEVLSPLI